MKNESVFETYLYLSPKKIVICVIKIIDLTIVYEKKLLIENESDEIIFRKLQDFLDNNIFKLERTLNHFIENIFIVLDSKDFFPIHLSVKNDNGGNILTLEKLSYSLQDARYQCKKTINQKKIIHMLIENYLIDNKNFQFLPKQLECNNFSLDIKFICLSNNLIKNLENSLERYQISINHIISANYVENFFQNNHDLFKKVRQITNGCNPNEVKFYNKTQKNEGFFEKFFNFFK